MKDKLFLHKMLERISRLVIPAKAGTQDKMSWKKLGLGQVEKGNAEHIKIIKKNYLVIPVVYQFVDILLMAWVPAYARMTSREDVFIFSKFATECNRI